MSIPVRTARNTNTSTSISTSITTSPSTNGTNNKPSATTSTTVPVPAPAPTSGKFEQKKVDKTQEFNIETSKLEAVEEHPKEVKVKVEQK